MIPSLLARRLAALLAAALLTTGCGSADDTAGDGGVSASDGAASGSTGPTATALTEAAPAEGPAVTGDGYRLHLPKGWRDVTEHLPEGSGVDRAAGSSRSVGDFRSNINIVVDAGALSAEQLEAATDNIRERMSATAPAYSVRGPVTIAEEPAGHLSGLQTEGRRIWLEQFVVSHDEQTYVVSFSFSPKVPAQKRTRMIGSVLRSWEWQ